MSACLNTIWRRRHINIAGLSHRNTLHSNQHTYMLDLTSTHAGADDCQDWCSQLSMFSVVFGCGNVPDLSATMIWCTHRVLQGSRILLLWKWFSIQHWYLLAEKPREAISPAFFARVPINREPQPSRGVRSQAMRASRFPPCAREGELSVALPLCNSQAHIMSWP